MRDPRSDGWWLLAAGCWPLGQLEIHRFSDSMIQGLEAVSTPSLTVANERARAHARGVGLVGPRERACRGVRGAKPLGVIRLIRDSRALVANVERLSF